jgi:lysophospholipase L1-like esterase
MSGPFDTLSKLTLISLTSVLSAVLSGHAGAAQSAPAPAGWATSWYASPQPAWGKEFVLPTKVPAQIDRLSVRETVSLSAGGQRVRLVFSNRYGRSPVAIGAVRLAPADHPDGGRLLSFSGQRGATLAPGALVTSDPVELPVAPLARLTVTSYFPGPAKVTSFHWGAQQTIQLLPGDATASRVSTPGSAVRGRLFLNAVLVESAAARTVVALGDSITDGNGSTPDADRRWPDFLARRLAPRGIGVANAGISGARLLADGMGVNALARFEQDVLAQPGVTDVVVLLGINDIGWPGSPFAPDEAPATLDALAAGFRQLVAMAHARGVRVTGCTLPPFEGALEGTPYAGHYSPRKEVLRQALNAWIRSAGAFDAVADFDAVLRDPRNPRRMRAAYDSGDHLHPGDAGYEAMAGAIEIAPPGGVSVVR